MKKLAILSTLILTVGALSFAFINASQAPSAKQSKLHVEDESDRLPASFGKESSGLQVSVKRIDQSSDVHSQRLTGTIVAQQGFDHVNVRWILPAEVVAVSGQTEFSLSIAAGETKTFEILVEQKSDADQRIILEVAGSSEGGMSGSAIAHYFTVNQQALEKQSKENFLRAKEMVRSGQLRKIMY